MTTVNIQVTDASGQVWRNGSVAAQLQTSFSQLLNVPAVQSALDSNGSASLALTPNLSISPAGSQWLITVCPAATASCFSQPVTVIGTTQNVVITPPAIVLNLSTAQATTLPIRATAYSSSEIIGAQLGSIYYDLTQKSLMVLTTVPNTWSPVSGSGQVTTISLVADGITDNFVAISNAIANLGSGGGKLILAAAGTTACYVSQTITISNPSVTLEGLGWNNRVGAATSGTTLLFAAGIPGIVVSASSFTLRNLTLVSKDTGPASGDVGLWIKSNAPTVSNVAISSFGDAGLLVDSSNSGNANHWRFDDLLCTGCFADGYKWLGGTDGNIGTGINLSAVGNTGFGFNLSSGCAGNTFVDPHASANTAGAWNLDHASSNWLINVYVEGLSTSSFALTANATNNRVWFTAFGQPTSITNNGGASNQIYYVANSNSGQARNITINPPVGAAGQSYSLTNGIFNANDFTISGSDVTKGFGGTLLDFNYSLNGWYSLSNTFAANFTAATSAGSTNSPNLGLYSSYWNGSGSATDLWVWQVTGGAGTNGSSRLGLTHSGTSGSATFGTPNAVMTGATPTVAASEVGLGNSTSSTVGSAGGASALPATPSGYLVVNIGGTNFKLPYYAN